MTGGSEDGQTSKQGDSAARSRNEDARIPRAGWADATGEGRAQLWRRQACNAARDARAEAQGVTVPLVAVPLAGWLLVCAPGAYGASGGPGISGPARDRLSAPCPQSHQPTDTRQPGDRVVYRARVDVPVTVVAAATWIVTELEKKHLAAVKCRWCDESLNGFDAWGRRTLRWRNTGRAASWSTVTGFALVPAVAYGLDWAVARRDGRGSNWPVDAILISEAMTIASDVTQVVKFAAGRERPYVHVLPADEKAKTASTADNNTSFPSALATFAFSVVASSAEIAALRGYRGAPWIWRAGLPLAALTAYFRVAADRHYLTDVLVGAGVGSAVGFAVPYLGHRNRTDRRIPVVRMGPAARGGTMAVQWTW